MHECDGRTGPFHTSTKNDKRSVQKDSTVTDDLASAIPFPSTRHIDITAVVAAALRIADDEANEIASTGVKSGSRQESKASR